VLLDFATLSLLPLQRHADIAAYLRSGVAPADICCRLLAEAGRSADIGELRRSAETALARAREHGVRALAWNEPAYPASLSAIIDPPPVLWVRGQIPALDRPAVAIVGSRGGSAYALGVAEQLAADLVAGGVVVVSGLARGVDSAAHRGTVAAEGATIAVLGSGVDIIYPAEHTELANKIVQNGLLVSELPPGTPPLQHFFPRRNRIISGLSRAVVVIEANEKSGSLITARCALEQGRDVLAVPGNVLNGRNRGGHALIRDGAKIVETADDIFEELGLPARSGEGSVMAPVEPGTADGASNDPVLASLPPGDACDLDALAERTGLTAGRLLPRLLDLELRGLVRRLGGGRFARFDRSC
jgi:DNA processing protein